MKKLTFLFLIKISIIFPAFTQGVAVVCSFTSSGDVINCDKYSRVKDDADSPWRNACCSDVHVGDGETCTDDCGTQSISQPYEDDIFIGQTPTFSMPSGNNVWIYEEGEFLGEPLGSGSSEYMFMDSLNYDWINDGTSTGYFGLQIDSNTHAVVDRYAPPTRLKGGEAESSINAESISLYPNPIHGSEVLFFKVESIEQVSLINNLGQEILLETNLRELASNLYSVNMPENLQNGLYLIRILQSDGSTAIKKLMVAE